MGHLFMHADVVSGFSASIRKKLGPMPAERERAHVAHYAQLTALHEACHAVAYVLTGAELISVDIPGFANNVDVSGNYAYVAAGCDNRTLLLTLWGIQSGPQPTRTPQCTVTEGSPVSFKTRSQRRRRPMLATSTSNRS